VSLAQHRELIVWSDESPEALGKFNDRINSEGLGEKGMATSNEI
jgi:hypothetical protein